MFSCDSKPTFTEKDITGAWATDSIFEYTNGFVEKKALNDPDQNIIYAYDSNGGLTMKKEDEQRQFQYQIVDGDSLVYRDASGMFMSGYRILALSAHKLVLRKNRKPMFPGPNQQVYEIRQFSPVKAESQQPAR
ncbi:hypothetical protein ACFSUS_18770 [Spirosoma soli]|uniref:Lipocalin-like domain-containing protein n=1 Tax=Spirosoma soli TaxID=1770529 RepID=A0ABW5M6U0_9BACT